MNATWWIEMDEEEFGPLPSKSKTEMAHEGDDRPRSPRFAPLEVLHSLVPAVV